jgi:hypothetical protein
VSLSQLRDSGNYMRSILGHTGPLFPALRSDTCHLWVPAIRFYVGCPRVISSSASHLELLLNALLDVCKQNIPNFATYNHMRTIRGVST